MVVSDEAAPLEDQPNEQEDDPLVAHGIVDGMKSKAGQLGNKAEGYLNKAQGKLFTRLTHGTSEG